MFKPGAFLSLLVCGLFLQAAPLSAHHHHNHDDEAVLNPYPIGGQVDLTRLLAPPPAPDSAQTKMEIDELLKIQASRTDAQAAAAIADHDYSVFRFADVMGPAFNPGNLPLTAAFFARVIDTGKSIVEPAKAFWNRERPFTVDSRIMPVMKDAKSPSYPSGHSTAGNLMAIVLANMVPEKSPAIFARGWIFAQNRLIAGEHFPSDIQAGRISAAVIASHLFENEEFRADFVAARLELRKALGYPTDAGR
ncbi:MAG TPA: phosphatase PAP2 family protein [bacterium]|jgi:acid phosphatase (class A)|nr:phosphatase PAP2 family protein [bacterium]